MSEKERFGTINAFQRLFAEEGVEVTSTTIAARIEQAKQAGLITTIKSARLKTGRIIREGFYVESEVRAACRDLFNRLDAQYFSDPARILSDLTSFAQQLGEDKSPPDLSTSNLRSLSITCHNGETVRGETYLKNAAIALGLAKDAKEAGSKPAETLALLLRAAGFEITEYPPRNKDYYHNKDFVLADLTVYASQLGADKSPPDLSTSNLRSLSITCRNGETVKGQTYLKNAAIALGLAKDSKEANSKLAETLALLLKTSGIEIRDNTYYQNKDFVLYDLNAFAYQLAPDKNPPDLSTHNISSLSITCHNGETVKGTTYLSNAAIALGLAKDSTEAGSKLAETLALLLKTAGIEIRDNTYYQNKDFVLYDLTSFAQQLGYDKTPPDLSTSNLRSLSITCRNGETVKGETYLKNAAIALGLAKDAKEAGSKPVETLALLLKTAGIEIRDNTYYQNKDFVLYDLNAFAYQLAPDKTPPDLNTGNIVPLSITCHNGETVRGLTYLHNAAIALGLAKDSTEAGSKQAETLRTLKRIAGFLPQSTKSDD